MLKKIAIVLAALLSVVALAVVVVLLNINPIVERMRPQITAMLSESIGHEVTFEELSVSLFPRTRLELHNFQLSGARANRIDKLALHTSVLALLQGEVTIEHLAIDGATINLRRTADNSLFLGPIPLAGTAKQQLAHTPHVGMHTVAMVESSNESQEQDIAFALKGLSLEDVTISLEDQAVQPTQTHTLTGLHGHMQDIAPHSEGTIDLQGKFLSEQSDNVRLSGTVELGGGPSGLPKTDLNLQIAALDLARAQTLTKAYKVAIADLSLGHTADMQFGLTIAENGIHIRSKGIDATAAKVDFGSTFKKEPGTTLSFRFAAQPYFSGALTAKEAVLELGKDTISLPFSFSKNAGVKAEISSSRLSLPNVAQMLPTLQLYRPEGALSLDITALKPQKGGPDLQGTIGLSEVSLTIPAVDSPLSLSDLEGTINLNGDSLSTKDMQLRLAGQQLVPSIKVSSFRAPHINWSVRSENFAMTEIARAYGLTSPTLAQATFSKLSLQGTHQHANRSGTARLGFTEGSIHNTAMTAGELALAYWLDAKNAVKRLVVRPSTLGLFKGSLDLNGSLDNGQGQFSIRGSAMDLEAISTSLAPNTSLSLVGLLQSVKTDGTFAQSAPSKSLTADISARAEKGAVKGFNLLAETFGRIGKLPGLEGSLDEYFPDEHRALLEGDETKFDSITLTSAVANERVQIRSIDLLHTLYQVSAKGSANFEGEMELDARLKLTPALAEKMVLRQPKLELLLDQQRNLVIPVTIRKKDSVSVIPDISDLGKRAVRNTAKEAVRKELDKVDPAIGKVLEGLFK